MNFVQITGSHLAEILRRYAASDIEKAKVIQSLVRPSNLSQSEIDIQSALSSAQAIEENARLLDSEPDKLWMVNSDSLESSDLDRAVPAE